MDKVTTLFFVFSTLLLLPASSQNAVQQRSHWHRLPSSDNLVFSTSFLWSLDLRTSFECAKTCSLDSNCTSFTCTKMTSRLVRCRGHSVIPGEKGTYVPDTKLFMTQKATFGPYYLGSWWLTKACSNDTDCGRKYTVCFKGQCLCTPGYYYYTNQDACLLGCDNLQNTFLHYPSQYIIQANLRQEVRSLSNCSAWCVVTSECVSYEYYSTISTCYLQAVTPLDLPLAWAMSVDGNTSYWQRTCA